MENRHQRNTYEEMAEYFEAAAAAAAKDREELAKKNQQGFAPAAQ
jgi:hypothetical protein